MSKQFFTLLLAFLFFNLQAQEARLLRFPAVNGQQVVFSYAGDLYTVDRSGGVARRLTTHNGYEMFPKFSHDGKQIAFTGQYDGNTEVFTMPANGGTPKRITYTATLGRDDIADRMGPNNIVMDWTPDDQHVVYRSRRYSFNSFKGQLFKAPVSGDLSEQLPFSVGGWCTSNNDGSKLAYNRVFREFRTWKYYTGGMADDIWLYDFKSGKTEQITDNKFQDVMPMFYNNKIYFLSDRDRTMNIFEYDLSTKLTKKVTNFTEYDVKFPSMGDDAIAFENGGYIYLYNLKNGQQEKVNVTIAEDFSASRNRMVDASEQGHSYSISPDGKRLALGARGDIFTVPAKEGITRNLTQSSDAHDRNVEWSPDGKWLAYISDRTGEDELYVQVQDGSAAARQLTKGGGSYKYNPWWSPDSKKILLSDRAQNLFLIDVATGTQSTIYKSGQWEINDYTWSPDSKWVAYTRPNNRTTSVIHLYNIETRKDHQLTEEWYNSYSPVFDPEGKYLYFISQRDFNPVYSSTEWNHAYQDMSKVYFVSLQADAKSLFKPENDEVEIKEEKKDKEKKDDKKEGKKKDKKDDAKKDEDKKEEDKPVKIDFEGISQRQESLPISSGSYWNLQAVKGGLYYGYYASGADRPVTKFFSLEDKEEKDVGKFSNFIVSANEKKMVVSSRGSYYIENTPKGKLEPKNKVKEDGLKIWVDCKQEWQTVFNESWRQMRDFFYDPNMHGVDWDAMKKKYGALVPHVNHRNDLSYLIGEMIGELTVGHAYTGGGDRTSPDRIQMGLLGATFSRDSRSRYYKVEKIIGGENWKSSLRSPLQEVGVNVKAGDYIIAINGQSVKDLPNLFAGLIGTANKIVELTINSSPSETGARKVLVKPIRDESSLYYYDWVESNIAKVSAASNGEIGYLHIPDMGVNGLNQFAKYFYPQINKKALIIDDRGNGGGNVSPMIIERLRREIAMATAWRNGTTAGTVPAQTIIGPKVCLINQYSASDGDLFPYQFRHYGIGKLIGQRTWGGVVGIRGSLPILDGGFLNKPEFAHTSADGSEFVIEGHGVEPDIEVVNDPHDEFMGKDVQLEKAIEVIKAEMRKGGVKHPGIPVYPNKSK